MKTATQSMPRESEWEAPNKSRARAWLTISKPEWMTFLGLLILPCAATWRLTANLRPAIVLVYLFSVSGITFLLYRHDKRRAQTGGWRISESTLHFFEFAGGWPGAFLAQRIFHHKTAKRSFQ